MPRSIKAPQTGSMVWYYSAPTGVAPIPAIVLSGVDAAHFNLFVFDGTLAATGGVAIGKPVNGVLFTQQQTVASGAWCTYMRVNEFIAGTSPDTSPSNPGGSYAGGATPFDVEPQLVPMATPAEAAGNSGHNPGAHADADDDPDIERTDIERTVTRTRTTPHRTTTHTRTTHR